jgi:hypothetical protein
MAKHKSSKASVVTEDYVLEQFVDLLDSDASWAVKVKGLELLGKYLSMFQDQKKVDINLRGMIAGASLEDLQRLAGERYDESYTKMVGDCGKRDRGLLSSSDSGGEFPAD